jgi:hypothetical protein
MAQAPARRAGEPQVDALASFLPQNGSRLCFLKEKVDGLALAQALA